GQQPDVLSVDLRDTRGCLIEPAEQVQDRRLPGPARPDDRDELPGLDLEIDAGQGDDPRVADVVDLVDAVESNVRAGAVGSIPRPRRGSLVPHPGHSGSPRRTALIDERSSARVAVTAATVAAPAITSNETINAATPRRIPGAGNDVETVRSSGAVASRTTTSPRSTPAIEATPIRANCSRAIVPRSAGAPAPIARSDANSKSRRRCATHSDALTPAAT